MSSGSEKTLIIGQWVIIAGLCVQLLFFGTFMISSGLFHLRILQSPTEQSERTMHLRISILPRNWPNLLFTCYAVSLLIVVRSAYRLIEFVQGNNGYVISHEVFLYIFDAAMMFLVMVIMNVFHPSDVLQNDGPAQSSSSEGSVDRSKEQA
jgi:RTA1 like protein.